MITRTSKSTAPMLQDEAGIQLLQISHRQSELKATITDLNALYEHHIQRYGNWHFRTLKIKRELADAHYNLAEARLNEQSYL